MSAKTFDAADITISLVKDRPGHVAFNARGTDGERRVVFVRLTKDLAIELAANLMECVGVSRLSINQRGVLLWRIHPLRALIKPSAISGTEASASPGQREGSSRTARGRGRRPKASRARTTRGPSRDAS